MSKDLTDAELLRLCDLDFSDNEQHFSREIVEPIATALKSRINSAQQSEGKVVTREQFYSIAMDHFSGDIPSVNFAGLYEKLFPTPPSSTETTNG